jgi:hypothetical protein
MLHILIMTISAGLNVLKTAKDFFFPDKTINEVKAILSKDMADDIGSLREQIRDHRQVLEKLVEQVRADRDMLEKHNDVLIKLSEAAQQTVAEVARLRVVSYWAIGLAGLSILLAVLVWILK